MRSSRLLGALAAFSIVATPVLAAPSANPAASLALPSAGNVRAVAHGGKRNKALLGPSGLFIVAGTIAVGVGIAAATGALSGKKGT